jgi:hypothetical protein
MTPAIVDALVADENASLGRQIASVIDVRIGTCLDLRKFDARPERNIAADGWARFDRNLPANTTSITV